MNMNMEEFMKNLDEFISGPIGEQKPTVTNEDNGKQAEIIAYRFADTKYGRKLVIELRFENGEEKVIFLSKLFGKEFVKYAGKPPWEGKKVKITLVPVMHPNKKELVNKPFPMPIPE